MISFIYLCHRHARALPILEDLDADEEDEHLLQSSAADHFRRLLEVEWRDESFGDKRMEFVQQFGWGRLARDYGVRRNFPSEKLIELQQQVRELVLRALVRNNPEFTWSQIELFGFPAGSAGPTAPLDLL
jgi:hypothetical protein